MSKTQKPHPSSSWKILLVVLVPLMLLASIFRPCLSQRETPRFRDVQSSTPTVVTMEENHTPTAEEAAWARAHLEDVWTEIEKSYPIESVRQEFVHVLRRIQHGEVAPNISVLPNAADPNVNCSADFNAEGKQRLTFYLEVMRRIQMSVDVEVYKDILIDCMVHENIHLEEQMLLHNPNARFTHEELTRGEAEAWCLTTDRILVPIHKAGRANPQDEGRREALAIYDRVGADCDDPLWIAFGKTMSPYNPLGNYK